MRGSPLFRALLAFAALLSLAWPLARLTRTSAVATAPAASNAAATRVVQVQMSFTSPPTGVRILHLGKSVLSEGAATEEFARAIELAWPAEGVDLEFQIDWPSESALAAARVRLTMPDGAEHERTIWSRGPASEVLTFP